MDRPPIEEPEPRARRLIANMIADTGVEATPWLVDHLAYLLQVRVGHGIVGMLTIRELDRVGNGTQLPEILGQGTLDRIVWAEAGRIAFGGLVDGPRRELRRPVSEGRAIDAP